MQPDLHHQAVQIGRFPPVPECFGPDGTGAAVHKIPQGIADRPVVAVYDPSEKQQDSLQKIADVYIKDYKSMINFLEKN